MTTRRDWQFRASYMDMIAKGLEAKSEAIKLEAFHYRNLAKTAQAVADDKTMWTQEGRLAKVMS